MTNIVAASPGQTVFAKMKNGDFMEIPVIAWKLLKNPVPVFPPLNGRIVKHWRIVTNRGVFFPEHKPPRCYGSYGDAVCWMKDLK